MLRVVRKIEKRSRNWQAGIVYRRTLIKISPFTNTFEFFLPSASIFQCEVACQLGDAFEAA